MCVEPDVFESHFGLGELQEQSRAQNSRVEGVVPMVSLLHRIFDELQVALRFAESSEAQTGERKIPMGMRTGEFEIERVHVREQQ